VPVPVLVLVLVLVLVPVCTRAVLYTCSVLAMYTVVVIGVYTLTLSLAAGVVLLVVGAGCWVCCALASGASLVSL
jgi:hypothetical protein